MVGRRLAALLVVLLVIGAVAAALAPEPARQPAATATQPTTTTAPRTVARTIDLSLPAGSTSDDVVKARSGDLVRLTVASSAPGVVTIDGLDRREAAEPNSPARFEFFAEKTGTFAVRLAPSAEPAGEAGAAVGRLEIAPAA